MGLCVFYCALCLFASQEPNLNFHRVTLRGLRKVKLHTNKVVLFVVSFSLILLRVLAQQTTVKSETLIRKM